MRELSNVIERAVVLSPGPLRARPAREAPASRIRTPGEGHLGRLRDLERSHILAALEQTRGVLEGPRGAALVLLLHPNTLRSRMKKLGIR